MPHIQAEPVADLMRGLVPLIAAGEQQCQRQRGNGLCCCLGHQYRYRVGPMHVLQHDEQRLARGSGGHRLDNGGSYEPPVRWAGSQALLPPRQLQADGGQRTAPRPQGRHARCRARAAGHLHPSLLSLTDQPVGEHGFAHPGLAKQQRSPPVASPSARQRGGKLGLLTVAADDRHVGGQVHAHTQPHALLTARVW